MDIEALAPDIWTVNHEQRLSPGFFMNARMTLVRRGDEGLWMHSPVPIDSELEARIDDLGRVTDIVAPSCLHHLYAEDAANRWPEATLHLAPGLCRKRPDLRSLEGNVLLPESGSPWPEIDCVAIEGADMVGEYAFFHRASGSLIVTDLMFNITEPKGVMTHVFLTLAGARGRLAQSRVWRLATRDRPAAKKSCERLLAWEFERLVPAHGAVVDTNARQGVERALSEWMMA